jgi:hypothetical protein
VADSSTNGSNNTNTTNYNNQVDNTNNSVANYSADETFNAGDANLAPTSTFGDGAMVASSTLSNYVSGVKVTFAGTAGESSTTNNSLTTGDTAFQNFAGMQALNVNTGAGASQNANVSVAVTAGDINR